MVTTNLASQVKTCNLSSKNIIERTFNGSKKGALLHKTRRGQRQRDNIFISEYPAVARYRSSYQISQLPLSAVAAKEDQLTSNILGI